MPGQGLVSTSRRRKGYLTPVPPQYSRSRSCLCQKHLGLTPCSNCLVLLCLALIAPSPESRAVPMHLQSSFPVEGPEAASPRKYRWEGVLEIVETGPASLCSLVLWRYAGELDEPYNPGHVCSPPAIGCDSQHTNRPAQVDDSSVFGHVLAHFHHPAPKLVLVSALGFGCCVSSFVYRRQGEDPFQVLVFALVVGTVATVAYGAGASSDLLLLGYMPFATCASMVLSLVIGHAMRRRARCQEGLRVECPEKLQLP